MQKIGRRLQNTSMSRVDDEFKNRVYELVGSIPEGRLATYGQIAALAGAPWAAWEVGQIAHFGPRYVHTTSDCLQDELVTPPKFSAPRGVAGSSTHSSYPMYDSLRASPAPSDALECERCGGSPMPWQRVVNKQGGLARGYSFGGLDGHKRDLEKEGVKVSDDYVVDIKALLWQPEISR